MSKEQAEIKASLWTKLAAKRSAVNYRSGAIGKDKNGIVRYAVFQFLGDQQVGIAAS